MWKTYKLQDLILKTRKVRGILTKEYQNAGKYPIVDQGSKFIAGYSDDETSHYEDDLPVVIFGDHTLAVKYIDFEFCAGADGTQILKPNEDIITGKFLYYSIIKLNIQSLGYSRHFKLLKEAIFQVPSLEEQKRIVHILDQADFLRQKRQEAISLLDDYLKAVFLEMLGDPVTNPKGWEIRALKEITSKIGSGATPRGGKNAYKTEGVSLIRSLNIHDNKFLHKNLAFIDDNQAAALSNVTVEPEDILLNITGASVCRCTIVDSSILPARVNQHVSILRSKKNILNPQYLLHLIISHTFKQKLLRMATAGGATREALTKQQIEQLEIPTPPIKIQEKFALSCELFKKIKRSMLTQSKELNTNFDALMQKAFNT